MSSVVALVGVACGGGPAASTTSSSTGTSSTDPAPSTTEPSSTAADTSTAGTGSDASSGGDDSTGEPPPPTFDCTMVACHYLRADAAAGGDGSSWDSAWQGLPDRLERGAVYLVADGSYEGFTLGEPELGDAWITIAKATADDHGSDVGWDPDYGDGQAEIDSIVMISDRWIVDGRHRDEAAWSDVDAYGFRIPGGITGHTINFGRASNDAVFRYLDIGGPPTAEFDESIPREGFYFGGFDQRIERWIISRVHVHDVYLPFQIAGASDITIEHSWLGPNWSKETIRGQGHAARIVIRHNVLKDGCQGTPGDPTAGSCTGQIAMWDSDTPGAFDASEIYGNVIWTTKDTPHSDACILVGGDGGISAAGVAADDVRVYNNTLVGVATGRCSIRLPGEHTGTEVVDNLWFGLGDGVATDCEADRCEANEHAQGASPFVDAASGDFELIAPTAAGAVLPPPYDVDRDGTARGGDGTWDLGALEFVR